MESQSQGLDEQLQAPILRETGILRRLQKYRNNIGLITAALIATSCIHNRQKVEPAAKPTHTGDRARHITEDADTFMRNDYASLFTSQLPSIVIFSDPSWCNPCADNETILEGFTKITDLNSYVVTFPNVGKDYLNHDLQRLTPINGIPNIALCDNGKCCVLDIYTSPMVETFERSLFEASANVDPSAYADNPKRRKTFAGQMVVGGMLGSIQTGLNSTFRSDIKDSSKALCTDARRQQKLDIVKATFCDPNSIPKFINPNKSNQSTIAQ